jgi:hypothetical protein
MISSPSLSLLQPAPSTNTEDDDQEFESLTEQPPKLSMFNDDEDNDDLSQKVERCFRNNSEQPFNDHFMQIDQTPEGKTKQKISFFELISFNL